MPRNNCHHLTDWHSKSKAISRIPTFSLRVGYIFKAKDCGTFSSMCVDTVLMMYPELNMLFSHSAVLKRILHGSIVISKYLGGNSQDLPPSPVPIIAGESMN